MFLMYDSFDVVVYEDDVNKIMFEIFQNQLVP